MRWIRAWLVVAALLQCGAAGAQALTSPGPDSVSVTVYRAPDRSAAMDLDWLEGYALVTETRRVTIPAGRTVIRFEGVAGRMLPESAIVTGLPDGVLEKNLDADLLSPYSLYDRTVGRPVTIRRTIGGRRVEERAIIRSGPDGAAVLETREGFIAVNCGPQKDQLVYDSVPAGLSARPTLSVETVSSEAREVTLTLSYLAWGFDWQANYVATMRPDGRSADLFAWVTLANGDVTTFAQAETMVVAGAVENDESVGEQRGGQELGFSCFYQHVDDSSVVSVTDGLAGGEEIVVTAQRRGVPVMAMPAMAPVTVVQEDLGDLKLYRVPHATTVAAKSMKQVALLDRQSVPVDIVYRNSDLDAAPRPATIVLRAQNRKEKGLGLALPAGAVAVFEPRDGRRLLIGEGAIADRAVNEDVEVAVSRSAQVQAWLEQPKDGKPMLVVTNANPRPVRYETEAAIDGKWRGARAWLIRRHDRELWSVDIPANGTARLRYR